MTDLILVRHGETDWNRELRFQGQLDVPLNAVGRLQAERVAQRLARETIHQLISSDLSRALQTATAVVGHPERVSDLSLQTDTGLREQHFGRVEGLQAPEVRKRYPDLWNQWVRFDSDFAFEGAESTARFHARVLGSVQRWAQAHPRQTLLLVTHGGVLDMLYRSATAQSLSGPRQCLIPNAGISRVRVQEQRIEILEWADTRHLAGLPEQPVYDQTRIVALQAR